MGRFRLSMSGLFQERGQLGRGCGEALVTHPPSLMKLA